MTCWNYFYVFVVLTFFDLQKKEYNFAMINYTAVHLYFKPILDKYRK